MKTTTRLFPIALALLNLMAVGRDAQAVSPAPDGGYPGGNTAEGQNALFSLTTGGYNTAVGFFSLGSDTAGAFNTALGAGVLFANSGGQNTATGAGALLSNTAGGANTANGAFALFSNTTGSYHAAIGFRALFSNTTGDGNTAYGYQALSNNTTGNFNIALGDTAGLNVTTASNVICIGVAGNNVDNSCYIGQIFGATSSNGVGVFVNSNGRLGTMTSSRRFKERIEPMGDGSEALFSLEPVSFRYKKEVDPESPEGRSQFGLVAEDVDKLNPDLVVRDKEGKPYSVRYDQVNAMLLNEFLKEHKAFVQEQHKVEKLEATVANLMATVKEQASQIQKVSAQIATASPSGGGLELIKSAPQTVLNDH